MAGGAPRLAGLRLIVTPFHLPRQRPEGMTVGGKVEIVPSNHRVMVPGVVAWSVTPNVRVLHQIGLGQATLCLGDR
ncbi:MAG TPA: hypothetical protein VGW38_17100 [Chloroflexota bacterium]|nr:hypothetical protein [Chloroflexota bacterium]